MEYKTVRGGDEFLPLARNLVRRLRASGQSYAAQKISVGSATITVRLVGPDDFITIEGGAPTILSGIIKAGEVVNIPADPGPPVVAAYDTLRALKPTQNCWDTTLRKNPDKPTSSFNDEKKLAKAGTQYADLAPSMFSGLMAKAVQVLMGMGIEVKYKYEFDKGHGIVLDSKGKPWLVEISRVNGVIAQKLGITPIGKNSGERNDALRKCVELFGGTPNGKTFPKDAALTEAIEAKSVLRLATVDDMKPFFEKSAYTQKWGWSFNTSGSEAHNTCHAVVEGVVTGFHYKLVLTIDISDDSVDASAVLTEVSSGPLNQVNPPVIANDLIPFSVDGAAIPFTPITSNTGAYETTIFVRHKDDSLDRVRVKMAPVVYDTVDDPATTILTSPIFGYQLQVPGGYNHTETVAGRYIISDLQTGLEPQQRVLSSVVTGGSVVVLGIIYLVYFVYPSTSPFFGTADFLTGQALVANYTNTLVDKAAGPSHGYWAQGCRDGVVLHKGASTSAIRTYDAYDSLGYYPYFPNWQTEHFKEPTPSASLIPDPPPSTFVDTAEINSGAGYVIPSVGDTAIDAGTVGTLDPRPKFFSLRNNTFGDSEHIAAVRLQGTDDSLLSGPLLNDEPPQSGSNYNFIGYLA